MVSEGDGREDPELSSVSSALEKKQNKGNRTQKKSSLNEFVTRIVQETIEIKTGFNRHRGPMGCQ